MRIFVTAIGFVFISLGLCYFNQSVLPSILAIGGIIMLVTQMILNHQKQLQNDYITRETAKESLQSQDYISLINKVNIIESNISLLKSKINK